MDSHWGDPNHRPRTGQWVCLLIRNDFTGERLRWLVAHGAATSRNGKLVGIYQRYQSSPTVLLNGERQGPAATPERIVLVDRVKGSNLVLRHEERIVDPAYVLREEATELEPVLDRSDVPPGRKVRPGYVFRP